MPGSTKVNIISMVVNRDLVRELIATILLPSGSVLWRENYRTYLFEFKFGQQETPPPPRRLKFSLRVAIEEHLLEQKDPGVKPGL